MSYNQMTPTTNANVTVAKTTATYQFWIGFPPLALHEWDRVPIKHIYYNFIHTHMHTHTYIYA